MKAGGGGAGVGGGEAETGERGHDYSGGGLGFFGVAEQEADLRAVDALSVGGWGLGEDDAGLAWGGEVGDGAEVEREAAEVDGGGSLGLADEVGDGDLLGAEAFGDADGPLAADLGAGGGGLGEDVAGWSVGGVELVFEVEAEAEGVGFVAGVGDGEAGEVGDYDLAAVDGETHGDEGGGESYREHGEGAEEEIEEALHCYG